VRAKPEIISAFLPLHVGGDLKAREAGGWCVPWRKAVLDPGTGPLRTMPATSGVGLPSG